MAIKDRQADDKISDIDPLTPLKVRPIRYKRYVDRYIALVKKQEALNCIIN
jgi:carbamoylphosphate synthase large subunit